MQIQMQLRPCFFVNVWKHIRTSKAHSL